MVGTKWFKCDLHLHTPASKCFRDKIVTAEQWVAEALNKGLNCVAVTDHNSAEWVELIQKEAETKGLFVFPGVEITCSDAKVHLLILFDKGTSKRAIEDFITLTKIPLDQFGEQDAHSPLSVEEILKLSEEKSAICIPAHIDEYNGICQVAHTQREKLLEGSRILGVQVVHKGMMLSNTQYDKEAKQQLLLAVNKYYGVTDAQIELKQLKIAEDRLKDWRSAVVQSVENGKAILTFSDNPHAEFESKHGLWGMGRRYTWIKMDQVPSLESLRQALLLHRFRIKNDFDCPDDQKPYSIPDTWIKSITIKNTEISHSSNHLHVDFNPQMNTIIGGRGSGKSALLQFMRGVFGKESELDALISVKDDFKRFFKIKDKRDKQGVLKAGCVIEIVVNRRDELFLIRFTQVNNSGNTKEIFKFNAKTDAFDMIQDISYLAILDFDIFSQKQIYEIATNLNSLRERIDESAPSVQELKQQLIGDKLDYKKKSSDIRALKAKTQKKDKLKAEILDIESKIQKYEEIGIEKELQKLQGFQSDSSQLKRFGESLNQNAPDFDGLSNKINANKLDVLAFSEEYRDILKPIFEKINSEIDSISASVTKAKTDYSKINESLSKELETSTWQLDKAKNSVDFEEKKLKLQESGVDKIEEIEGDIKLLNSKKLELDEIARIEREILEKTTALKGEKGKFIEKRIQLTTKRKEFLDELLATGNVKAKVDGCRDFENIEEQIRLAMGSPTGFEDDVAAIVDYWNSTDVTRMNDGVFKIIMEIFESTYSGGEFGQRFINKIQTLNGEQIDDFDLMFPEDQIQLQYKTNGGTWKPLSNASAGQKTAAILTLLLSQGTRPLILDQPEDDLDNHLIYDLVVDQLRKSKEQRQIITVTHNANIPVNGDSEFIVVMDSETKHIQAKLMGSIEDKLIKESVCTIMEGGTEAFEMRSKRYKNI